MKVRLCSLVAFGVALGGFAATAHADVIPGPVLNSNDSGWQFSGVGFIASVNSTLTSFTFQNQGHADNVLLVDPLGNTLDSIATPFGNNSDTVSVNWSLTAGSQYYLLQSTSNNSLYSNFGAAAPSDTQIALTDTGVFSHFVASSTYQINGTMYWAAFNNITTTSSATPEPRDFKALLGIALACVAMLRWRRKQAA